MRGYLFWFVGLALLLAGCGGGGTTKQAQTTTEPSIVQVTIGGTPQGRPGKVSYAAIPTNVKSVGLMVTGADMVPVFAAVNVTAGAASATLTVSVPPGPARSFGVNAYDGLMATGTVLYQGYATADVLPNTAVNVPITLGFLGGSTTAPTQYSGLLASSFTVGQINLTWPPSDPSQSITGYVLYMAETAWTAPWTAALPGQMRHPGLYCCSHTHIGLVSSTRYYFALTTVNAIGESPESAQVSAIPNGGGCPGCPGGGASGPPSLAAGYLASNLDKPLHIALDPGYVYWSEDNGNPATGKISRIPKSGGSVTVLATGLTAPDDIAVDDTHVYWGEDRASGNISKVQLAGGTVTDLATGRTNAATVALSSILGAVFWLENPSTAGLRSISKMGGSSTGLITPPAANTIVSQFTDLVVYESSTERAAYWATKFPASALLWSAYSTDGGATLGSVGVLTTLSAPGHQLAVDKTFVYWAENYSGSSGAINKVSRCCGAVTALAGSGSINPNTANLPFAVAVDDTFVYWTQEVSAPNGAIKRVAIAGGPVTTLADGLHNPKTLAVDGTTVYWTEANATPNGAIRKVANGRNAWFTKAPLPTARAYLAAAALNNVLYVAGGIDGGANLTSLTSYNPLTNTWRDAAPLASFRRESAAVVLNNVLYVVGGTGADLLTSLSSYNPLTNTWLEAAPLPTARRKMAAGVINGVLYAAGGLDAVGAITSLTSYNPLTNTWRDAAPLPTARYEPAAGVLNNILYVAGGISTGVLTSLTSYNPLTNTWLDAAPMPTARSATGGGVIGGKLYVVGGCPATCGSDLSNVEAYDPSTNTWTTMFTPMPTARRFLAAGVLYNTLYAVGGLGPLASLEAFTPP